MYSNVLLLYFFFEGTKSKKGHVGGEKKNVSVWIVSMNRYEFIIYETSARVSLCNLFK